MLKKTSKQKNAFFSKKHKNAERWNAKFLKLQKNAKRKRQKNAFLTNIAWSEGFLWYFYYEFRDLREYIWF